ncbi:MAG: Asp-tRNA(Asn)/Glu-tRNA(Gln) amidotransferase subunit GatC [Candidatus Omnitrophota bacterium]|nr:MAG: Asp-tRNA(Asn)/Glu-tRNA(Gln) amidotransferase subunit GatC [Candidatus Omnitrophota bacterium]
MTKEDIVAYVANLARIHISREEKEFLEGQLTKILDYIGKLKELDVEGVEPMSGFRLSHNITRDDVTKQSHVREDILRNAPNREGDYFKVPKVIE